MFDAYQVQNLVSTDAEFNERQFFIDSFSFNVLSKLKLAYSPF